MKTTIQTKIAQWRSRLQQHTKLCLAAEALLIVGIVFLQYFQLQYSVTQSKADFFLQKPVMLFVNMVLLLLVNLLFSLVFQRWTLTLFVTGGLFSLWSIADYFCIQFHGGPLLPSVFSNARTALNVASGYHLGIDGTVKRLLVLFALECMGIFLLYVLRRSRPVSLRRRLLSRGSLIALSAVVLYAGLFSDTPVKPKNAIGWSWGEALAAYGFPSCALEDGQNAVAPFVVPEGYRSDLIQAGVQEGAAAPEHCPDIILILNESFFDLDVYNDIQADQDYLAPYYQIGDAVYGKAVVPNIGGWTNNTEFELLTGNSMYLLHKESPFNYIAFAKTNNNLVQYLKAMGYTSYAMHVGDPVNYSRGRAYPEMGFDHVLLQGNFTYQCYGNRDWLDADNYRDMIGWYEAAGDGPRFMYLLTYQNHGGHDRNPDELDLVHTTRDFGSLTDDINEYLTSVSMSAEAFSELIGYFSQSDRDVIVCMLGDHGPSLIRPLSPREGMSSEEQELTARMVPYVLWANYDAAFPAGTDYVSVVDLPAMLAEMAGLPLSPYYRTILDLHEDVPVRTSYGAYVDAAGNIGQYQADSPYYEALTQYYYMEYHALKAGSAYRPELYAPVWNTGS